MAVTVVHHFDVVPSARLSHPVAARFRPDLSGCCLEYGLDGRPSSHRPARHERRSVTSALLATRNAGTNEEQALLLERFCAADRILVVRIATVNDNVAFLEVRLELINEIIDSFARLYEEHDLARSLELSTEFLD